MDLNQFSLFQTIAGRLGWTTQRQAVLAQNIANVDTPGYRARDIEDFARVMARATPAGPMQPVRTHAAHLAGRVAGGMDARIQAMAGTPETAPSGNNVSVEQQLMALTDTAAEHRLALELFRRHTSLLRTATGARGR